MHAYNLYKIELIKNSLINSPFLSIFHFAGRNVSEYSSLFLVYYHQYILPDFRFSLVNGT